MNKTNKNLIVFSLKILAILTFSITAVPALVSATSNNGFSYGVYTVDTPTTVKNTPKPNPEPVINSVSPKSSNVGVGTKTVTIVGEGFVSSSIVRINGSNRPTTFVDSSHLLVQISGNDTLKYSTNGGFFITVWNGAPGGGNSNAVWFSIINPATGSVAGASTNTPNNTNDNFTDFNDISQNENNTGGNFSNLAASAIYGSNSLLPSGLLQWIFFAILILLVVIMVRRIHGADQRYHATPMKHD